jgi:hypothetical protein
VRFAAEPDPVLDPLFDPGQLDMGEAVGCAIGRAAARAGPRPVMVVSFGLGKFAREQIAQHVGDGDAAPERGDLDPAAQLGVTSMVSRAVKPSASARAAICGLDPARDRPGAKRSRGRRSLAASSRCRGVDRRASAAISRAAGVSSSSSDQPARLRGGGEGDALADGGGEHGRIVIGQRLGRLAGEHGARAAAVEHEAAASSGR